MFVLIILKLHLKSIPQIRRGIEIATDAGHEIGIETVARTEIEGAAETEIETEERMTAIVTGIDEVAASAREAGTDGLVGVTIVKATMVRADQLRHTCQRLSS
jgi:hypothetical protein